MSLRSPPQLFTLAAVFLALSGCDRPGKVLFEESTPDGFVRIASGDRRMVSATWRSEKKREVNGNLQWIFSTIYGWDRPRIVVDSPNRKIYCVTFEPTDPNAAQRVARPLGLQVTNKEMEIDALTVKLSASGHHLKSAKKKDPVDRYDDGRIIWYLGRDGTTQLDGISMPEFAVFLEGQYRVPVVDCTGLGGYWSFAVSDESIRHWPEKDEMKTLDDTGLELRWERIRTEVVAVEDAKKND